jgi:uncharacterized repeat protein (TIGR03803 family)
MGKKFIALTIFAALMASAVTALAYEKETVLYQFSRQANGWGPQGQELIDSQGNIFGVASEGLVNEKSTCCGMIYELIPQAGGGYSYNVIYAFSGLSGDAFPEGYISMDASGNIYGSTAGSYGEVYRLSPNSSGGWSETVLWTESASGFGATGVAVDASGNVYGTAAFGGANNRGFVFEISPSGGSWTTQDIYDFSGPDGSGSVGSVILDAAGNLYGTTPQGGSSTNCSGGCGVVFELTPNAGHWTESVLLNFNGGNGSGPQARMTFDTNGNLYGTTWLGGPKNFGVVFELTPNGTGGWKEHILHAFSDANGDGAQPDTPLVVADGVIYGATLSGGSANGGCSTQQEASGCGTVFKLTLAGTVWKESILHSFTGLRDGAFPGGVSVDASGNLFGLADSGGDSNNDGVSFELTSN